MSAWNLPSASHRLRRLNWRAALYVGFAAGAFSILLQMLLAGLAGESVSMPPRRIAAMLVGETILSPGERFGAAAVAAAGMIHFAVALLYALIVCAVVHRMRMASAGATGLVLLMLFYLINFYALAPLVFPWFAGTRGMLAVIDYMVFGALVGAGYIWLRRQVPDKIS